MKPTNEPNPAEPTDQQAEPAKSNRWRKVLEDNYAILEAERQRDPQSAGPRTRTLDDYRARLVKREEGGRVRFVDPASLSTPPDGAGAALPISTAPLVTDNTATALSQETAAEKIARRTAMAQRILEPPAPTVTPMAAAAAISSSDIVLSKEEDMSERSSSNQMNEAERLGAQIRAQAQVAAKLANIEAERTRKLVGPSRDEDEYDERAEAFRTVPEQPSADSHAITSASPKAVEQVYKSDLDPAVLLHHRTLTIPQIQLLPDPVYLLDGFLSEDSYAVLYGRSQSFKSFVALDWAMQVARTKSVIYIAGEGKLGYKYRTAAWLEQHNAREEDYDFRLWDGSVQMADPLDVGDFLAVCAVKKPGLIVMDTLSTVTRGLDENSSRDMGIFVGAIQRIRHATGACVLVVHHSGKDGTKGHRGSSKIIDDADTAFCVERKDMKELVTNLKFEKAKDAELRSPLAITLGKIDRSLAPLSYDEAKYDSDKLQMADHTLSEPQRRVLVALDNAPEGLSYSELIEATGVSKGTFSSWMGGEFAQYVEKTITIGRATLYTLTQAGQDVLAPWNIEVA